MRRILALVGGTALMILALLIPASPATAANTTATHHGGTFSFVLITPNFAVAESAGMMAAPGDWIEVTGGGTFSPATGAVHAGGVFVHHNVGGVVHCRGTWRATALTGWTDLGAAHSRAHGGVVSLLVTHHCATTGEVHVGIPMTVTSTRNASDCSRYVEGVTVGEFTRSTAGSVVIRAHGKNERVRSSFALG